MLSVLHRRRHPSGLQRQAVHLAPNVGPPAVLRASFASDGSAQGDGYFAFQQPRVTEPPSHCGYHDGQLLVGSWRGRHHRG
eukprot:6213214-Pleurochrysis_carterae.AAC.2